MNRYPHVAARLLGVPLAIEPGKLRTIVEAIGPRLGLAVEGKPKPAAMEDEAGEGATFAETKRAALLQRYATIVEGEPVEVAGGMADYILTPGGVAIVPVVGTLVQRFDWLAAWSGLMSYDAIGAAVDQALADYRVKGIMLDVDSPGGEVGDLFDGLARKLLAARDEKPLWAVANSLAASAGFAIAASSGRLLMPRTAYVGSVGVVAIHVDRSKEDALLGRKYTAVYSGARKIDGWDHAPLSDEAARTLQAELDEIRLIFADAVAEGRGIKAASVLATEANCYLGEAAIEIGFADAIAPFDEALALLHQELATPKSTRGAAAHSKKGAETMKPKADAGAKPKAEETKPADEKQPAQTKSEDEGGEKPAETTPAGETKPAETGGEKPAEEKDAEASARAARADAAAIVDLCTLAGEPTSVAAELIRKGASVEAARRHLAERRDARVAAGTAPEIHNKHAPPAGAAIDTGAIYARWNAPKGR